MGTMKAVVKTRPERGAEFQEVPIPHPGPGEVLVKVLATSICGSDLHIYEWNDWAQTHIRIPQIMGHEMAGEVVEVGKGVSRVKVGDYVSAETHIVCGRCYACRTGHAEACQNLKILGIDTDGAFAEYVVIPEENAWINDPSIPPEIATLQEPTGNAVDTALAEDISGKTVLITGQGPVGLITTGVAAASGASLIITTDLKDSRLELSKKMGATYTLNPLRDNVVEAVMDLTGGNGVDVFLEVSGSPKALAEGFRALAPGGRASLLGLPDGPVEVDLNNWIIFKGVRVYGIIGRKLFSTWYKTSRLILSGKLDLRPLITHRLPLSRFHEGMEAMARGETGKVVLFPEEKEAT